MLSIKQQTALESRIVDLVENHEGLDHSDIEGIAMAIIIDTARTVRQSLTFDEWHEIGLDKSFN